MAKESQNYILPEDSQRTTGKHAQRNNIMAARIVAETVRTTLGPKGMDKMLVDPSGNVIITNDGVTILEEMQIEHPGAKMIVEIAKTQEKEVGDGTTTAVVLAGEFLKKAEPLLDQNIHPTLIARGYRIAAAKSMELLDKMSRPITDREDGLLKNIALTAMTGKGAEMSKDALADLTVKAIRSIMEKTTHGKILLDREDIRLEKKVGSSVSDTELVRGIVLDKEKMHAAMPNLVKNARILLLNTGIEIKDTETDAKIQITAPEQMQAFLDMEETMIRNKVNKVIASKANVVFCQKGIDDVAAHLLAKQGIFACRRVRKTDMDALARATGGKVLANLEDVSTSDLGAAGVVEEKRFGSERMVYVSDSKNPKTVTLLIRGSTEHIVDEVQRALEDAVGDIASALSNQKVVAGAGSSEIELSMQLRKYASSLEGREQLAVLAFAEALEIIPRTLAENGGFDPIDVLAALKAAHQSGKVWFGVDAETGKVYDAWKAGVLEPLKIKTQAISSAAEVAEMILRIDDVIAAGKIEPDNKMHDAEGM